MTFQGLRPLATPGSQARVMPNAAASRAMKPLATVWVDEFFAEDVADAEVDGVVETGTGVFVATASKPPVLGPESEIRVSLAPMAFAWVKNASNVFPVVGALIEPTNPEPQCLAILQKNQMGCWSFVTVMVNCFPVCKPESNPAEFVPFAGKGVQGSPNELCVTECWIGAKKKNVTVVPLLAVKLLGLYTS